MKTERTKISASKALALIKANKPLKDLDIRGKLITYADDDTKWLWHFDITFENCIVEEWMFVTLQTTRPIVIANTHFKKIDGYAPYFLAGLSITNSIFDTYLDLQSGGHNKNDSEVRLEGNIFKNFTTVFIV